MDDDTTRATVAGGDLDPDRLLTYAELAELVQLPERTMRHTVNDGRGPRVIRIGKHARFRIADVRAWLAAAAAAA